ncbi:MAG: hypothetical protein IJS31_01970 [Oscillospiraceae bacterium]|nr:hypothetical protein [Oscillospiraceae bacterium]
MRMLKWFFLLSKRLYKKWMFLVLICLIPLSVLALKLASAEKAGFAQIAVVNPHTEISDQILEKLNESSGILRFLEYESADDALADLSASRLDAVWVLPEDLAERFAAFVNDPKGDHYIVKVYRQEDSLKTRLALEKLSAAMFPYTSRMFFLKCMREDAELDLSKLTDEEILDYYDRFFTEGTLFTFAFPDGVTATEESERNYLTSPIRGLLSIVVLLAGLSAAMLYIDDEKKGVFAFAKSGDRVLISFACQLTAILNVAAFVFAAVFLLGVNTYFLRELAVTLIFVLNTALFCTVLQQLLNSLLLFAPTATVLTILDVLICPIFFDLYVQKTPQYLLPNAYYINAVHSNVYLRASLAFTAVSAAILLLIYLRKRRA